MSYWLPCWRSMRMPSVTGTRQGTRRFYVGMAIAVLITVFLGFSRFPAARSFVAEDGTATVRWSDVRFITGALDDPRQFRRGLFGTTVILAPDGSIRESRLGP